MYKILMTLTLFSIAKISFSQSYSYDYIIRKADSIMISKVGLHVFQNNYTVDSLIRYSYKRKRNKILFEKILIGESTKERLVDAQVIYVFSLNIDNSFTPTLTYVKFDSLLNLEIAPNTEFIPNCIMENKSCSIILKEKAIEIAKSNFREKIGVMISAHFGYLASANKFIWTVINEISNDVSEDIRIDAISGEIIDYYKGTHVIVN